MKTAFWKKFVCLLLVLVSVISILPMTASAATLTKGDFQYTVSNGRAAITSYIGNAKDVTVPATLNGYPVYSVETGTFWMNETVESITFSEGIRSIATCGDSAIYGCPALKTISLPASLQVNAPSLSDSVVSGTFCIYSSCDNVQEVNVASSNQYITSVNGVVFNKNKTSILCYPSGKTGSRYVVPSTVNYVADSAFAEQKYLQEVVLPDQVEFIGYWSFSNAGKLEKINIPAKCEIIGQFAFQGTKLQSLHIPANLEWIMTYAFCGAPIEKITVDKGNTSFHVVDGVLYQNSRLVLYPIADARTSYVMPATVTAMDPMAFDGAENLTQITLGKNLTAIPESAFWDCWNLKRIIIPQNVKSIGGYAFANCYELDEVFYSGTKSQWRSIQLDEIAFPYIVPVMHYGASSASNHSKFIHESYDTDCVFYRQYACSCNSSGCTGDIVPAVSTSDSTATVSVWPGEAVTIGLSTHGEGLTYKWYYKDKGASKFSLTKSFTGNSYSISMDESRDGRQLYCVITDANGNTVRTKTVTLVAKKAAQITTQPKNAYAKSGSKVTVSVGATGDGLSYTWYYKNKGASSFSKSSVKGATYSTTMDSVVNGRQVYCVVKDQKGNTVKSDTVKLIMGTPAKITAQPKSAVAAKGATVKASVTATGDGLSYTWYYKNKGASSFSKSSVKSATYATAMSSTVNGRQVYCVVKDKYGNSVKSSTVTLTMGNVAKITVQPKAATAANGATVKASVTATGDGLSYTWYYKNKGATSFSKSSIAKATYATTMSSAVNGRQVYCVVKDKYGNSVKSSTVTLSLRK